MTKMKSKKMTKSTFAIIIMAIAMVAMLAFGGTYAYFTATAGAGVEGSFHTATVKLSTEAEAVTFTGHSTQFLPGEELTATITYQDESTRGTWVFFRLAETETELPEVFSIGSIKVGGVAAQETSTNSGIYYVENSKTDETVGDVVNAAELVVTFTITFDADAGDEYQNTDYTVAIEACSVQHFGLTAVADALAESAFAA